MKFEEPEVNGTMLLLVSVMFSMLFGAIAFGAWAYFKESETIPVERISEEGVAKAAMILELTGYEFPPEIAKHANVTFSGSSVSIDTEKLNVWLGKNWQSK